MVNPVNRVAVINSAIDVTILVNPKQANVCERSQIRLFIRDLVPNNLSYLGDDPVGSQENIVL